ncbi:MAG: hypothetical protein LBC18_00920 [Opitutaceae bacterium]|nr:hypothetical protein [Opitutaceae bacterium]
MKKCGMPSRPRSSFSSIVHRPSFFVFRSLSFFLFLFLPLFSFSIPASVSLSPLFCQVRAGGPGEAGRLGRKRKRKEERERKTKNDGRWTMDEKESSRMKPSPLSA